MTCGCRIDAIGAATGVEIVFGIRWNGQHRSLGDQRDKWADHMNMDDDRVARMSGGADEVAGALSARRRGDARTSEMAE